MIIIGLIVVYLLGFSITFFVFKRNDDIRLTVQEALGLSFLIGIGVVTVFMFLYDLLHIPIKAWTLLLISVIITVALSWKYLKSIRSYFQNIRSELPHFKSAEMNLAWTAVFLIICFLLIGSVAKSLYWPTTSYDSVAGYDLMAKVIAAEGKIKVSLFDMDVAGKRGIYPPLVEGSFAYAYLFGSDSSKIITSLTYLSLILLFYALLRKYVNPLNAVLFSLLMIVTPEMFAHSSLSLTNMPGAAYAAPGLLYLFLWMDKKQKPYLYISAVLLGLNVWARNDGVVFNAAGFLLLLYDAIKSKRWKEIIIFSTISFLPLFAWTIYLKLAMGVTQDRFVNHLFWDAERFGLLMDWIKRLILDVNLYGLTFYIFFLAVLINIKDIFRDKSELLLMIVLSFIFYSSIYYQFDDTKQDSLNTMMRASFKRALFYFVPMVLFYASTNKRTRWLFAKIDAFITGRG